MANEQQPPPISLFVRIAGALMVIMPFSSLVLTVGMYMYGDLESSAVLLAFHAVSLTWCCATMFQWSYKAGNGGVGMYIAIPMGVMMALLVYTFCMAVMDDPDFALLAAEYTAATSVALGGNQRNVDRERARKRAEKKGGKNKKKKKGEGTVTNAILNKKERDAAALQAKIARKKAEREAAEAAANGGQQQQQGNQRKRVVKQNLDNLRGNGPMKQKANHKGKGKKAGGKKK